MNMRHQSHILSQRLAAGILFCLTIVGCASFPGGDLPTVTYQQIIPHDPKPSIDYEAVFVEVGWIRAYETSSSPSGMLKAFQDEINKVFSQSGMFSGLNAGAGSERYH